MTINYAFQPSPVTAFQFQPTLDGNQYNIIVTWNLFGKRYYFNIFALDGTLIVTLPLISSASGFSLSTLSWNIEEQEVTAVAAEPLPYEVGTIVNLSVSGCSPTGYNGAFSCFITGPQTFTYPLTVNPGALSVPGAVSYDINLIGGYFDTSTLVYREATQQFEVGP